MADHDPKCLAYGFGPGQRMDICICTGIRIGRADERERLRAQVEEMYVAAIRYYEASGHSHGMGQMDAFKRVLRLLGGESDG